jgi:hypothetical protein
MARLLFHRMDDLMRFERDELPRAAVGARVHDDAVVALGLQLLAERDGFLGRVKPGEVGRVIDLGIANV